MDKFTELEAKLQALLPIHRQSEAHELTRILLALTNGETSIEEAGEKTVQDTKLTSALIDLKESSIGDIAIGSVARVIYNLYVTVSDLQKASPPEKERSVQSIDYSTLQDLRRQARNAYFQENWKQAVEAFTQLVRFSPEDNDSREKLIEASKQLQLEEDYKATSKLRDTGNFQAVCRSLRDLESRQPKFPDPENLRQWVTNYRLLPVQLNTRYGFIDRTGDIVIKPQFSEASYFYDNLARVKINEKSGYVDNQGNASLYDYGKIGDFSEGLAAVRYNNKWGYIDKEGNFIINPEYDDVRVFSEGLAAVERKGKWGHIDKSGRTNVPVSFDGTSNFSDGLAAVKAEGKWGYIDYDGRMRTLLTFDDAREFSEGLAAVQLYGKWGYIDRDYITKPDRPIRIEPRFNSALKFSEDLAAVQLYDEWGYIDKVGRIIIDYKFDSAFPFSEGLAAVKMKGKWGYIDKVGRIIIDYKFDSAFPFSEGLAAVRFGSRLGYIDKFGNYIWEPTR